MTSGTPSAFRRLSPEARVGLLFLGTIALAFAFMRFLGVGGMGSLFSGSTRLQVTYNFAGGIEVGSPVRVSGIKVGQVEKIEFFVPIDRDKIAIQEPGSGPDPFAGAESPKAFTAPLRVTISIAKDAAKGVRADSRFYINIAGIIGERYVEITPGTEAARLLTNGDTVMGVDPPRIDQLLSQSFDLAGKVKEILTEHRGEITNSIDLIFKLSKQVNQTLAWVDKSAIFKTDLSKLVENLIAITNDVKRLTAKTQSEEGKKTLDLLHQLLWRLEPLDGKQIREFLQKEGIRAKIL